MSSKMQASKEKLTTAPRAGQESQHLKKAIDLRTVIHWKTGQVNLRAAS